MVKFISDAAKHKVCILWNQMIKYDDRMIGGQVHNDFLSMPEIGKSIHGT